MTTSSGSLEGMAFKLQFLRAMLPVMNATDGDACVDCMLKWYYKTLKEEDVRKVDELYSKFEKGSLDAQVPKT